MDVAALLGVPEIAAEMGRVEDALRDSVATVDPFLTEVAGHLVSAGGKRIRPALTMAAALAAGSTVTDDVIMGGVAVELVHIGSLYHDDVMDEADSRRGVESVNHRWGNLIAILAGDFLLAKASEIAASLGTDVAALLARTIGRLCEGQVGELQTAFNVNRSEEAYLASISGKTASLTSAACRIGGLVARRPAEETEALTEFGESFGMAFQIRDDILDVVGDEQSLGKPAGQDLVEGTYSLPIIRALADPAVADDLKPLLGSPLNGAERDRARDVVRSSRGVGEAMTVAREYAARAAESLEPLRHNPAAEGLMAATYRLLDQL
ncbi:MAG TPA: polyprenyl synthetase family protein [Acidimicrobiales bacterium]|jgi:heptaprenyl diphosphate synthase|nr:polyprenyl synthetase family protein [Acidimicrobiales bacterium]